MVEKLMNGMLTFAAKLSSQRHLGAIRNAFTSASGSCYRRLLYLDFQCCM